MSVKALLSHRAIFRQLEGNQLHWTQFHGSTYHRILRLRSPFSACMANAKLLHKLCKGWVPSNVEYARPQATNLPANRWNTLDVSAKFPASESADSLPTVGRAKKLVPVHSEAQETFFQLLSHCPQENNEKLIARDCKELAVCLRLSIARRQQTYRVNFHCLRSSEHAHNSENNGFTR